MKWVEVGLFRNHGAAEPSRRRLEQEGIPARVAHESWLQRLWFVPKRHGKACLEVPVGDCHRAEKLRLESDAQAGLLRETVRCPECKSLRVAYPQFARHALLTNLFLGLAAQIGLVEKDYYCEQCYYTWPREGLRKRRDRPHLAPYYFIEGIEQTTANLPPPSAQGHQHQHAA